MQIIVGGGQVKRPTIKYVGEEKNGRGKYDDGIH